MVPRILIPIYLLGLMEELSTPSSAADISLNVDSRVW